MSEPLNFPPPQGPRFDDTVAVQSVVAPDTIWQAPAPPGVPARTATVPTALSDGTETGPSGYPMWMDPMSTDVALIDFPESALPLMLTGLNGAHPKLLAGGAQVKMKSFSGGIFKVLAKGGGYLDLKMKQPVPGFPKLLHNGNIVYRAELPPVVDRIMIWSLRIVPMLFVNVIIGYFLGLALAGIAVRGVKRGDAPWKRRLGGWLMLAVVVAIGIMLAIAYVNSRYSQGR